ncbi:MAG: fructose-1,6-bisphosphatase [Lachnospiraceae bacterium]|nr:fructose-1,6-bisphosphatase [Lachnospiraceae bacterium]
MRDIDYLRLLSHEFPNANSCAAEIINLRAILELPKGNEYFFSDIHGEYKSFIHLLRSASGVVGAKINEIFGNILPESEQLALANLVYYPEKILADKRHKRELNDEWYRITIHRLIIICREVGSKYTRSKVRKKLPQYFDYAIDELLHLDENEENKRLYYQQIIKAVIMAGVADDFIIALSELIQGLLIDNLHVIGDIFDRGPRADYVMDELASFHDVDIQWGNHDVSWMGAAAGNTACIATVLRIATSYNSFDVLEDGYGINLRPLSMFAAEVYKEDACEMFKPHLLDMNKYDSVEEELAAKMCKAITIIELKLEGQLIKRHPEYNMSNRLFLESIDYEKGTVQVAGKEYVLKDSNFPTIDPKAPYTLTPEEESLVMTLKHSFLHSAKLQKHIRFLYSHGSMYKVCNNNLLFHGCIPMNEKGEFICWEKEGRTYSGRALMDYLEKKIIDAYFLDEFDNKEKKKDALDLMWYLWAGPDSPLFGKDKMTTFEHIFINEPELSVENYNPYYEFSKEVEYCDRIFDDFGMSNKNAHIINGHVPVKVASGEHPVKADGKLYVIDGGLSKAYHSTTGIAGYTLIFNSRHLALAEHKEYVPDGDNTPKIQVTEVMEHRLLVKDTDYGKAIRVQIQDLIELKECYNLGLIKEK